MWTEAWKRLLARDDALGDVARSSLWGLTAQLRRAGELRAEQDDGRRDCLAVADALGALTATPPGGDAMAETAATEAGAQGSRLAAFVRFYLCDREVARALGEPAWEIANAPDATLWSLFLVSLLRVDMASASRWRARAIEAIREAGFVQAPPSRVVPMIPWPPADNEGVLGPDLRLVRPGDASDPIAAGIRFDEDEPFDPRFNPPPSCAQELVLLARIAAAYAVLCEIDIGLWHAPARSSVLRLISGEERTVYLNRLADGFHAVIAAESRFAVTPDPRNGQNLLDLCIDLDESFHSLLPLPVNSPTSWWSRTHDAARSALLGVLERIRARGIEPDLAYRVLKGPYDVISAQSARDIRLSGHGPPGQVVACLRVYVESSRGPRPGRVVFITS
jgi:hypothetical protein